MIMQPGHTIGGVTQFLSEEWIAELDARLATAPRGSAPDGLVVQYLVDDDGTIVEYHLELGPDRDRARRGRAEHADITFRMDLATARLISNGELSTEQAFITGALDLEGDPGRLIEAYRNATDDA